MPSQIKVGLARKVGLPRYSSLGAACEVTLEAPDPACDPRGFAARVRHAFAACEDAVRDELARQSAAKPADAVKVDDDDEAPCTAAQSRSLAMLCRRVNVDLDALARSHFSTGGCSLTSRQAATLIAELTAPAALSG